MMFVRTAAIVYACLCNIGIAQIEGDISESEATSCIYAIHLNNSCIRKFDVLFRKSCFHQLRDKEGQEESAYTRIILDLDAKKFLHLHRAERKTLDENGIEMKEAWFIAAKYNHGKIDMSTPIMHFRPIARSFDEACRAAELIDVRFAGITRFPIHFGVRGFHFQERLAAVNVTGNSGAPYRIDKRTPTSTRIVQRAEIPNSQGSFGLMTWNMDSEKTMPIDFSSSNISMSTGQQVRHLSTSAECSWHQHSECYVPRCIDQVVNSNHRTKSEDGKEVSYIYPRDEIFDFHWFSVNETIPDSLIDDVVVTSFEKWMPMTDPKLSHATELE